MSCRCPGSPLQGGSSQDRWIGFGGGCCSAIRIHPIFFTLQHFPSNKPPDLCNEQSAQLLLESRVPAHCSRQTQCCVLAFRFCLPFNLMISSFSYTKLLEHRPQVVFIGSQYLIYFFMPFKTANARERWCWVEEMWSLAGSLPAH